MQVWIGGLKADAGEVVFAPLFPVASSNGGPGITGIIVGVFAALIIGVICVARRRANRRKRKAPIRIVSECHCLRHA